MLSLPARRGAGFTLLEIVVTLSVIGILAAVLTPQILSRTVMARSASLVSTLTGLQEAVNAHRGDVGRYPLSLTQLVVAPTSGVRDTCGRLIPGFAYGEWAGPYLDRSVAASGIEIAGSVVAPVLRREPAGYSDVGTLFIDAAGVDAEVARQIETTLDGTVDYTSGNILWVEAGATGRGTLSLAVPVRGC